MDHDAEKQGTRGSVAHMMAAVSTKDATKEVIRLPTNEKNPNVRIHTYIYDDLHDFQAD